LCIVKTPCTSSAKCCSHFALRHTTALQCTVEQKMHNFWLIFFSQVEAIFASWTFVWFVSHRLHFFLMSTVNCDCAHFWNCFNNEHSQPWFALIWNEKTLLCDNWLQCHLDTKPSSTVCFATLSPVEILDSFRQHVPRQHIP